jgi:hypothetical protein
MQADTDNDRDDATAKQIEAVNQLDLNTLQKVGVVAALYRVAPGGDELERRRWTAQRLGMQLRDINRCLWHLHGIRWPTVPAKRRRQKPADGQ